MLFADIDDRIAALSELELGRPGERLRDAIRRVADQAVGSARWDAEGEETEIRRRTIASRPSLQAAALLHVWTAERALAGGLHAAYPDELDPIAAAAVVGALMSALRAAADTRAASPPLAVEAQRVVDRVHRLLVHGLEQ